MLLRIIQVYIFASDFHHLIEAIAQGIIDFFPSMQQKMVSKHIAVYYIDAFQKCLTRAYLMDLFFLCQTAEFITLII